MGKKIDTSSIEGKMDISSTSLTVFAANIDGSGIRGTKV
jgi:hypothetical protein